MISNRALPWLPKKSSSPLDEVQKPYYCESNYNVRAVLPRRPCLALHRCALPVHLPPTTWKASALAAPREGACEEQKSPRKQGALSASS